MKKELTFDEKYEAILEKNAAYEGQFFTAVKTTGIFCRPTCNARKPKAENVEFFDTVEEALRFGYRPCKVCHPTLESFRIPPAIKALLTAIRDNPYDKIKDFHLRGKGMQPVAVRRWFQKNFNMTFHAYQRQIRINNAFEKLMKGASVTEAAFASGYESLSGFNDGFTKLFGDPASIARKGKQVIHIERLATPLGPMFACATEKGLCMLEFTNRKMLETEFSQLQQKLKAVILPGKNQWLDQTRKELKEYFEGKRTTFEVPLDAPGTDFQQKIWALLQKVPFGETRSYSDLAVKAGSPTSVRAVAGANGMNRISIIIPCHRIIGKDGELRGYGGGLERKRWLLQFESNIAENH
ncbi:MAG: methylated-DNA--[protein]-cysteine S-methyltransferase [Saprospiraceae bacterium]|nr:methylated-DNA--[protein]-cysteine S-methyltransferase [Saprospiraceae bacterium]